MEMIKKSQRSAVLGYMMNHEFITAEEAFTLFGVTRISSVISDLRDKGYLIETVMVEHVNRFGNPCKYGRFYYKGVADGQETLEMR